MARFRHYGAAMGELDGKVALVTGAIRRPFMGAATARALAAQGAAVVCADACAPPGDDTPDRDTTVVRPEALEGLVEELRSAGHRAVAVDVDSADPDSVARAITRTVMEYGRLDICCHMGGGTAPERDRPLMEIDVADFDVTTERNLRSVFVLNKLVAERMIRQGSGGAIVNVGSFAAVRLGSGPPAFSAVKLAAEALTRLFARELAPHGIRVNMVHPLCVDAGDGPMNPGLARNAAATGRSADQWMRDMVPMGRYQSPDEVAAVVAFLCGSGASFTSGQAISISGGAS